MKEKRLEKNEKKQTDPHKERKMTGFLFFIFMNV